MYILHDRNLTYTLTIYQYLQCKINFFKLSGKMTLYLKYLNNGNSHTNQCQSFNQLLRCFFKTNFPIKSLRYNQYFTVSSFYSAALQKTVNVIIQRNKESTELKIHYSTQLASKIALCIMQLTCNALRLIGVTQLAEGSAPPMERKMHGLEGEFF